MNEVSSEIWIVTDAAGFILDCSPAAVELLGYSARGARGRELTNLFVRERPALSELLHAARGHVIERKGVFRPNERKAVNVRFRIAAEPPDDPRVNNAIRLRWTFDVAWPVTLRLPVGVDRRQMITIWRRDPLRCVFLPAGEKRRLFVCTEGDEVIYEECPPDVAAAYARAAELRELASDGRLGAPRAH